VWQVHCRKRRSCGRPRLGECQLDICDRGSLHHHASITPRLEVTFGIPHPTATDTQAGDESQPSINRKNLAMVSTNPSEGSVNSRGIEGSDLDTRSSQHRPARAQTDAERAEPVIEQPNADTVSRPFGECFGKLEPDIVPVDDIGRNGWCSWLTRWPRATLGSSPWRLSGFVQCFQGPAVRLRHARTLDRRGGERRRGRRRHLGRGSCLSSYYPLHLTPASRSLRRSRCRCDRIGAAAHGATMASCHTWPIAATARQLRRCQVRAHQGI
jgi:hypothetical protein